MSACVYFKGEKVFNCTVSYVLVTEEQFKTNKKESGSVVQEEERQSGPSVKKGGLAGDGRNKPMKGNSLMSTKKRKMVEMLEKKKRKKKKMSVVQ